jgi:FkbM family methyltransferase
MTQRKDVANNDREAILMPTLRQRLVSSLTRLYPFYSGCGAVGNNRFIDTLAGSSDGTPAWTAVPGGEVLASLNDYVGRAAFYVGDLDRKLSWICRQLIRPGDTALDIGANIGIVTVGMAKLVGKSGRVHSFEPNPHVVKRLSNAVERNGLSQVTVHPLALGSKPGELELHIPPDNAGAGSFVRNRGRPHCEVTRVRVERLSSIIEPQPIRLIKIDVEGFEAEVFRGADALLKSHPGAILFELNDSRDTSLMKLLREYDYDFLAIPKSLVRMRLRPFNPETDDLIGHDFLAVARGPQYRDIVERLGCAA